MMQLTIFYFFGGWMDKETFLSFKVNQTVLQVYFRNSNLADSYKLTYIYCLDPKLHALLGLPVD